MDVRERSGNGTSTHQIFLSGGLGYSSIRFPAILCASSNRDAAFYGLVLPIDIIIATGCTLLLIIFWSVHRVSSLSNLYHIDYVSIQVNAKSLEVYCSD